MSRSETPEADWARHQREIWKLYLLQDKPLKVVMEEMKQKHGFSPDKQQWVERLKQWGCHKNLKKDGWRFVGHQTRKRKMSNADEEPYVVLAGVRLSRDQVKKGIRNHCPGPTLKLPRHRSPSPHLPRGLSLEVYTPPPLGGLSWPQALPWCQFHNGAFQTIVSMIEGDTSGPLSTLLTTSLLSPSVASSLTPLVMGRRIKEIHNFLSPFMPESMADEHVTRAESMCQRGSQWAAGTSVELALFFYSNHLDFNSGSASPSELKALDNRVMQLAKYLGNVRPAIKILQQTGAPTAQALLDRFFASAVRLGRVDALQSLVNMGLDVRSRARRQIQDYDHNFDTFAPIDLALRAGNMEMVDFLLGQGATFTHFADDEEAGVESVPFQKSLDAALHNYAYPSPGRMDVSLVLKVLQAQRDRYSETELLQHLYRMGNAGNKSWRAPALPILDCLWKIEATSGLRDPLGTLVFSIRYGYGHEDRMRTLISRVPDLEEVWLTDREASLGPTLMEEAAWARDLEVCKMLLQCGARPDPLLAMSCSALQIAAYLGDIQMAVFLLENGADANYSFSGSSLSIGATPLRAAVRGQHVAVAKVLLDKNAEISATDLVDLDMLVPSDRLALVRRLVFRDRRFGATALVEAARQGNLDLAKLLVQSGADWACENEDGETPLSMALSVGYPHLANHILHADSTRYDPVALLAATCSGARASNSNGGSDRSVFNIVFGRRESCGYYPSAWSQFVEGLALATAVCLGDEDTVVRLLKVGVRLVKNSLGVRGSFLLRFIIGVKTTEVHGVGPESAQDHTLIYNDATIVGTACLAERPGMVETLLSHGHRPNHIDLAIAAWKMRSETIERLLAVDRQSGPVGVSSSRAGVLAALIHRGFTGLANSLLDEGVDVNARQTDVPHYSYDDYAYYRKPLQAAVSNGDVKLVKRLILMGAHVNSPAVTSQSATALQHAAGSGNIGIARLLVEHGADCNAPAAKILGRTALESAAENGRIDMLQYLLCLGVKTERPHDKQYFRAIRLAEAECHHTAAELLKQHREWSEEDHRTFATVDADDDFDSVFGGEEEQDGDPHEIREAAQGGHGQSQQVDVANRLCEMGGRAGGEESGGLDLGHASNDFDLTLADEYFQNWPILGEADSGRGEEPAQDMYALAEGDGGQSSLLGGLEGWEHLFDWEAF